MIKQGIAILLIGVISILQMGCSLPTPEQDLNALIDALNTVSNFPNLTSIDKLWITAAVDAAQCASNVLSKNESGVQEGIDIAACFASLPVVPSGDQSYISIGITALQIFLDLFLPQVSATALKANSYIRSMKPDDRLKLFSQLKTSQLVDIKSRVQKK